jgi:hypothetical protein
VPATVQEAPVDPHQWVGDWRDLCDAIHRDKVKDTPLGKGYESAYYRAFRLSPREVASLEDLEQLFSK